MCARFIASTSNAPVLHKKACDAQIFCRILFSTIRSSGMPSSAVTTLVLLFAAFLLARASADDATSVVMVEAEPYVQLDAEKHLAALDDQDIWLVEFFSPMCGSCAEFKNIWMEVASALNGQV